MVNYRSIDNYLHLVTLIQVVCHAQIQRDDPHFLPDTTNMGIVFGIGM